MVTLDFWEHLIKCSEILLLCMTLDYITLNEKVFPNSYICKWVTISWNLWACIFKSYLDHISIVSILYCMFFFKKRWTINPFEDIFYGVIFIIVLDKLETIQLICIMFMYHRSEVVLIMWEHVVMLCIAFYLFKKSKIFAF